MSDLTFRGVFDHLYDRLGPQGWWPAETPFEGAVGAILTQNTAWSNVERAIAGLKAAGLLAPRAIAEADDEVLADCIRPAGYFNVKAQRLKALCAFLLEAGDDGRLAVFAEEGTAAIRDRLLAVKGVGAETADSILLYALGRPVFVVDAYTGRIFQRLGLLEPDLGYGAIQARFEAHLPRDRALFNEYHALIVAVGKDFCKPKPRCPGCPLEALCPVPAAQA